MATKDDGSKGSGAAQGASADEEFLLGFQRVEAEVRAVPEDKLETLNLDVPTVVTTVLGAWPEIVALRDQVAALPGFDIGRLDKLRDYALALAHTHGAYRGLAGPPDGVAKLAEELAEIRDQLFADAIALAKRGVFDEARINKLRSGPGYKSLAFDVVGLVQVLRERWTDIEGRTAVQPADLDHAAQLAQRLITLVGVKEQQPVTITGVALLRQQAFTLLLNAYDEVRRALGFLRWHEKDADKIAPSLWQGRGGRGTPEPEPGPVPAPGSGEPPQAGTGGTGTTAGAGAAAATSPSAATGVPAGTATAPSVPVGIGLPGSPPFSRG